MGLEKLPLFSREPEILAAINFSMLKKHCLMDKNNHLLCLCVYLFFFSLILPAQQSPPIKPYTSVLTGAEQFGAYVPLLKNKRVGIVTNVTGRVGSSSIVDTLIRLQVNVRKIFGPEHGFRGDTEAGELVRSNKDTKTGLPVISLYGSNKKPSSEQLKDIDVLIYDIQDIGTRFYTYISTMCYAMEACAENNKEFIVLDRPNPNGFYIDGPVLEGELKTFLGLHPVPVVYGMTCGEYARMANEEGWLKNKVRCRLTVIPLQNYDRKASYELPVRPSPNIPNTTAVLLYPSLGLFEGTVMSLGRGTKEPFQMIGHPQYPDTAFSFIPRPSEVSKSPKYVNQRCYGLDLRTTAYLSHHPGRIDLQWLSQAYQTLSSTGFFETGFNHHAGNRLLQEQLKNHVPEKDIRESWKAGLDRFRAIRERYLLYPDF
jgi:uncharacterized protein YbbC (DUF1343 family)